MQVDQYVGTPFRETSTHDHIKCFLLSIPYWCAIVRWQPALFLFLFVCKTPSDDLRAVPTYIVPTYAVQGSDHFVSCEHTEQPICEHMDPLCWCVKLGPETSPWVHGRRIFSYCIPLQPIAPHADVAGAYRAAHGKKTEIPSWEANKSVTNCCCCCC